MFEGPDPFLNVYPFATSPVQGDDPQEVPPVAPAVLGRPPVVPKPLQPAPQVTESSKMALEHKDSGLTISSLIIRRFKTPAPAQPKGWYVVFHGTTPGVSHGP